MTGEERVGVNDPQVEGKATSSGHDGRSLHDSKEVDKTQN